MASSKRERELARMRAERQAARRAAAAARRRQRNAVIASVIAVAVVAAGAIFLASRLAHHGSSSLASAATPAASPSASPQPSLPPGNCAYPRSAEPAARKVGPPPTSGVETSRAFTISLKTSQGVIAFDLNTAKAPCTGNSFRSLVHFKYFDNTPCHRLTTKGIFVLQCGDPTGKGTGGPGYTFADENLTGATYPRGTVAMANSGRATNGSQFFLVYKDTQLPPNYTPFATITEGLPILDKVAAGGSTPPDDGKPKIAVKILSSTATAKKT